MRLLRLSITGGTIFLLAISTAAAGSMRCGNDLVNIGDSAFIIEKKCGDPVNKVHLGYTINEEKKRELIIEDWVYGPWNDYYYFLTMVGGRVSEIRSERR